MLSELVAKPLCDQKAIECLVSGAFLKCLSIGSFFASASNSDSESNELKMSNRETELQSFLRILFYALNPFLTMIGGRNINVDAT